MRPNARCAIITRTARCASCRPFRIPTFITSPIRSAGRRSRRSIASRRLKYRATPTAAIIASATTTQAAGRSVPPDAARRSRTLDRQHRRRDARRAGGNRPAAGSAFPSGGPGLRRGLRQADGRSGAPRSQGRRITIHAERRRFDGRPSRRPFHFRPALQARRRELAIVGSPPTSAEDLAASSRLNLRSRTDKRGNVR